MQIYDIQQEMGLFHGANKAIWTYFDLYEFDGDWMPT